MHWLKLAQNVQNAMNLIETSTTTTTTTTNNSREPKSVAPSDVARHKTVSCNNNNPINQRRCSGGNCGCGDEMTISNNGVINDIPKIVGKLGRMDSNSYFQFKSNGIINETLTQEHATKVDDAMDQ